MKRLVNNPYIELLRISHWFKNLFVFAGVLTGFWYLKSFYIDNQASFAVLLGFFLACAISSSNYVINQIADAKFDARHPQKKLRPIPSGKISVKDALGLGFLIFIGSMVISRNFFSQSFTFTLFSFWVAGLVYNLPPIRFKNIPFIDVLSESINNPIRFLLGWFILLPESWPPLSILLLTWGAGALFMAGKRYDELRVFGKGLLRYRSTFKTYSIEILRNLLYVYLFLTLFLLAYVSIKYNPRLLIAWVPTAFFLFWIVKETLSGRAQARAIEGFVLRPRFLASSLGLLVLFIILAFW